MGMMVVFFFMEYNNMGVIIEIVILFDMINGVFKYINRDLFGFWWIK